jgi:hypothetical protein
MERSGRIHTVATVLIGYLADFPILKLAPFEEKDIGKIDVAVIAHVK